MKKGVGRLAASLVEEGSHNPFGNSRPRWHPGQQTAAQTAARFEQQAADLSARILEEHSQRPAGWLSSSTEYCDAKVYLYDCVIVVSVEKLSGKLSGDGQGEFIVQASGLDLGLFRVNERVFIDLEMMRAGFHDRFLKHSTVSHIHEAIAERYDEGEVFLLKVDFNNALFAFQTALNLYGACFVSNAVKCWACSQRPEGGHEVITLDGVRAVFSQVRCCSTPPMEVAPGGTVRRMPPGKAALSRLARNLQTEQDPDPSKRHPVSPAVLLQLECFGRWIARTQGKPVACKACALPWAELASFPDSSLFDFVKLVERSAAANSSRLGLHLDSHMPTPLLRNLGLLLAFTATDDAVSHSISVVHAEPEGALRRVVDSYANVAAARAMFVGGDRERLRSDKYVCWC